jgi:hypothetical protein
MKTGAGGFVTGLDIECDQGVGACSSGTGTATKVSRTNTNGAYWFNPATAGCGNGSVTGCWQQIVSQISLPSGDAAVAPGLQAGVYEIAIAPSNPSHFWMMFAGYLYSSLNKGVTWVHCNPSQFLDDANGYNNGQLGPHMAVDPANEWSVVAGTPTGGSFTAELIYSDGTNSACTDSWTTIGTGSVPHPITQSEAGYQVQFDRHSTSGGSTPGIYVASYGNGVYHTSTGPGGTWAELNSAGMPTTFVTMRCDAAGNLWLVDATNGATQGNLNEYSGGAWTEAKAGNIVDVATNPNTPANIYALTQDDALAYISTNTGGAWTGLTSRGTITTTDIPWIGYRVNGNQALFPAQQAQFDPTTTSTLYIAAGLGIYSAVMPTTATAVNWTSTSAAIEQMVTNRILAPNVAGAKPVVVLWDQCVLQPSMTTYPSVAGTVNNSSGLQSGWSGDWATSSPATIVVMCQGVFDGSDTATSGKSTNGGGSFAPFSAQPSLSSSYFGGCIAASTPTNILEILSNQPAGSPVYYTTDGGLTWNQPDSSLNSITTGWGQNYYENFQNCAADRVTANTFYLYNYNNSGDGLYVSTNSGLTWTRQCTNCAGSGNPIGASQPFIWGTLKSVPCYAGNLFFANGVGIGGSATQPFYKSTNSGQTWSQPNSSMLGVWAFGFGAPKNGSCGTNYPSIFVAGYYSGTYGFYRSDDAGVTWKNVGNGYPLGDFGQISDIDGDKNSFGLFYIGYRNSTAKFIQTNWLLHPDLGGNDNTPVGLYKVA